MRLRVRLGEEALRRGEEDLRRGEGLCLGEASLRQGEGGTTRKHQLWVRLGEGHSKEDMCHSLRRIGKERWAGVENVTFWPILSPFFHLLYMYMSETMRGFDFWWENTLFMVSPPFLNHLGFVFIFIFYLVFGVILKKPSTRGPHSTLEPSLEYFSYQIRFVSLTLTLFSSLSLLWM